MTDAEIIQLAQEYRKHESQYLADDHFCAEYHKIICKINALPQSDDVWDAVWYPKENPR